MIMLSTETETSTEHKLLVQLVTFKWLYEISINTIKYNGDRAITILSRFCLTNLQNFSKKPISIKRKLINRRAEIFLSQIKGNIETINIL